MNQKELSTMIREENGRLGRGHKFLLLSLSLRDYLRQEDRKSILSLPECIFDMIVSEMLERDITYHTGIQFPVRKHFPNPSDPDKERWEKIKIKNDSEIDIACHNAYRHIENMQITLL